MNESPEMVAIGNAVVEEYLVTGEPVRPDAIATRLGWSGDKVRRLIRKEGGFVPGCHYEAVQVATYSKSYRGMQHGVVKADAYLPHLSTLRKVIVAAREAAKHEGVDRDLVS